MFLDALWLNCSAITMGKGKLTRFDDTKPLHFELLFLQQMAENSANKISVESNNADDNSNKYMSTVHYLPCKIHYNGSTDVNNYFQVIKTNNNKHQVKELKSAFRGRELIGKEVALPSNVVGIHAIQQHQSKEKYEMTWEVSGNFEKLTVWQHDISPDLSTFNHALEWFDIANEVICNSRLHFW